MKGIYADVAQGCKDCYANTKLAIEAAANMSTDRMVYEHKAMISRANALRTGKQKPEHPMFTPLVEALGQCGECLGAFGANPTKPEIAKYLHDKNMVIGEFVPDIGKYRLDESQVDEHFKENLRDIDAMENIRLKTVKFKENSDPNWRMYSTPRLK